MTKDEAIQFFRDACASKNTYKTSGGYGPGSYMQMMLHLPESRSRIATLITLAERPIDERMIRNLYAGDDKFDLTVDEAESLRSLWSRKGETSVSPEYARSRF